MSFNDTRIALEGHFQANWSVTPIGWANYPFERPEGQPFVLFFVNQGGDGQQVNLGQPGSKRFPGFIQIDVYAPEAEGAERALQLADQAGALFDSRELQHGASGLIRCRTASIIDDRPEGPYYRVTLRIKFRRDVAL